VTRTGQRSIAAGVFTGLLSLGLCDFVSASVATDTTPRAERTPILPPPPLPEDASLRDSEPETSGHADALGPLIVQRAGGR
jgi:hypothetical protein